MAPLPFLAAWLALGAPAPHVAVAPALVVYGSRTVVTVTVPPPLRAQVVTVTASALGRPARTLGTFGPGATRWRGSFRPRYRTVLRAVAGGRESAPAVLRVRPRVRLAYRGGVFVATVQAARSYTGRAVILQRRRHGHWSSLRRGVLRPNPRRFRVALPPGRSIVRAFVPESAAEPGYLAGFSAALTVRR